MSNQVTGIRVNKYREQQMFDMLPAPIRHVIAHAPYDYAVSGFVKHWHSVKASGADVQDFKRIIISKICDDIQKDARKTYGKDHPDAQRNRLDSRRRAA